MFFNYFNVDELPPLHAAAASNDESIVKLCLLISCDEINKKESFYGYTPLHIAATNNNFKVARVLLNHGADVNEVSEKNLTALHIAISNSSLSMVNLLLEYQAEVNPKINYLGKTPLYMAVEYGCPVITRILLDNGASVYEATLRNSTLLHVAVRIKNWDVTKVILRYVTRQDLKMRDNQEMTALDLAYDLKYERIIELLEDKMSGREKFNIAYYNDYQPYELLLRNNKRIVIPDLVYAYKMTSRAI